MNKDRYKDQISTPFSAIVTNNRCTNCLGDEACPLVQAERCVRVLIMPPSSDYNYVRIDECRLKKALSVVRDIKSWDGSYFSDGNYQIYCLRDDDKDKQGWMEVRWQGI